MAKAPCCWASNELSRDKENYIRCSTRPYQPKSQNPDDPKAKKDKKGVCCATAFRMKMAEDAAKAGSDDLQCGPSKGKGKKKGKKPEGRCYTANMICQKLYMPGRDFECQDKLRINANVCKGCKIVLCANRINVNCLPSEPSARFSMAAECLEKELEDGITVSVVYMKKEIGRGCFVPPESVILRMMNTFQEVVYTANVELTCKGCTVGMATIRLSMIMHCPNIEDSEDDDDDCGDSMASDSQGSPTSSTTDPCLGFASFEDASGDTSCLCKSAADRYEAGSEQAKLIDVAGPYNVYGVKDTNEGCLEIRAPPGPGEQFSLNATHHLGEGNTNRMCPQTSAPKLKQMGLKRGRECPVCHEDVSWLPLISACPHCGYKPVPVFEEKEYNEQATAKDILEEFFDQLGTEPKSLDAGSANGSICQQADVRTSEGFENIVQDFKTLQQSIKKAKAGPAACPLPSKSSQRGGQHANLVNVFTELQKLFKADGGDADKQAKIKEICEEACKLAKASKKRCKKSEKSDPCGTLKLRKHHSKRHKMQIKSRVYAPLESVEHSRQGHAHCHDDEPKVPAHMGWLWTQCPLAQNPNWRPGAIRRSIRELMSYFLKDFPVDSIPISKYMSYHKQKPKPSSEDEEHPEDLVQVPTLTIEKKNDEYIITLRPLKDPETLKRSANPYAKMKPVQFRITKNPLLKQVRDLKRCLKKMGFSKCKCHKPVMQCYCRSFIDKKQLVDEVERQCHDRQMANCSDELVLSDTTDSEAEFDFGVTPPAGLMHPERLKKTHITHTETQYNENDWAMPTMYPHPPNAHVQYGGCVVGERQGKFDWIFGKGFVHKTPKPPKMRNMPKPKPKRPFPGAPMPREKGGYASEHLSPRLFTDHSLLGNSKSGERLQRLNRAARPPTALQFKQSRESQSKKVRFNTSSNQRFFK